MHYHPSRHAILHAPLMRCTVRTRRQSGVVLVIALLMLVAISLVASLSIRNATSSEAVAGSVRTTQLATQAAEVALRYCEKSVVDLVNGTTTFATTFAPSNILAYSNPPQWTNTAVWDSVSAAVFVLPADSVNAANVSTTYSRMPECMVETLPLGDATGVTTATKSYVITARGFGPEVPADVTRARPKGGSEIWLQSVIAIN